MIENIEDHIAYTCKCGGVNFALLKSSHIECNKCGEKQGDARWGDGPLGFQIRRAITAEDALQAMTAERDAQRKVLEQVLFTLVDIDQNSDYWYVEEDIAAIKEQP